VSIEVIREVIRKIIWILPVIACFRHMM
jgi:hypothetical protein